MVNLVPAVLYGCAVAINAIFHIDQLFGLSYFNSIRVLVCFIGIVGALYSLLGGLKAIVISDTIQGVGMVAGAICIAWFGFRRIGDGSISAGVVRLLSSHKEHLNAIGGPHDAIPLGTLFTGMLLINLYYWGMEQYCAGGFGFEESCGGSEGYCAGLCGKAGGAFAVECSGVDCRAIIYAYRQYGDGVSEAGGGYPAACADRVYCSGGIWRCLKYIQCRG
jgi:uncharacterized sodium:solute symporter family permease YidK